MDLPEQIVATLDDIEGAVRSKDVAEMIEEADHAKVAETLEQLAQEGTVIKLESIVPEDVVYRRGE